MCTCLFGGNSYFLLLLCKRADIKSNRNPISVSPNSLHTKSKKNYKNTILHSQKPLKPSAPSTRFGLTLVNVCHLHLNPFDVLSCSGINTLTLCRCIDPPTQREARCRVRSGWGRTLEAGFMSRCQRTQSELLKDARCQMGQLFIVVAGGAGPPQQPRPSRM